MADNLGVRAFSSPDEGTDFPTLARVAVVEAVNNKNPMWTPLLREDTYVVWFAYILGGWKAMVSTKRADGAYYEVTHKQSQIVENGKGQIEKTQAVTFVDFYTKTTQYIKES